MNDAESMRLALALAERGRGWTAPNPMVGAVIVKDGAVIGQGWHERYGEPHAERNALASCTADPAGATMYVTLEPCCHTGKQPPCTEALIAAGIARVVVGSRDPNPLVAGKGCEALRAAGIRVDADVLRAACDELNSVFFHFITHKTPYVVAKWAMSADGKIACASGDARWITGPEARVDVHELRHRLAAICVGIGTVLADDPRLLCETPQLFPPVRVILDRAGRLLDYQDRFVFTDASAPTWLVTTNRAATKVDWPAHVTCCKTATGRSYLTTLKKPSCKASTWRAVPRF